MLELGEREEALLEKRRGAVGKALLEERLHVHALKVLGQVRWEAGVHSTRQCLLAHFHPFLSALLYNRSLQNPGCSVFRQHRFHINRQPSLSLIVALLH